MYSENRAWYFTPKQQFLKQYAHSVDGQIQQQHVLSVERLPYSGLPLGLLYSY